MFPTFHDLKSRTKLKKTSLPSPPNTRRNRVYSITSFCWCCFTAVQCANKVSSLQPQQIPRALVFKWRLSPWKKSEKTLTESQVFSHFFRVAITCFKREKLMQQEISLLENHFINKQLFDNKCDRPPQNV